MPKVTHVAQAYAFAFYNKEIECCSCADIVNRIRGTQMSILSLNQGASGMKLIVKMQKSQRAANTNVINTNKTS